METERARSIFLWLGKKAPFFGSESWRVHPEPTRVSRAIVAQQFLSWINVFGGYTEGNASAETCRHVELLRIACTIDESWPGRCLQIVRIYAVQMPSTRGHLATRKKTMKEWIWACQHHKQPAKNGQ